MQIADRSWSMKRNWNVARVYRGFVIVFGKLLQWKIVQFRIVEQKHYLSIQITPCSLIYELKQFMIMNELEFEKGLWSVKATNRSFIKLAYLHAPV